MTDQDPLALLNAQLGESHRGALAQLGQLSIRQLALLGEVGRDPVKGEEWWLVQSPLVDDVGGEVEVGRAGDPVLVLVLQLRERRH